MSSRHTTATVTDEHGEPFEVDLKDRYLAAFLAWLIPGLGHLYQRRFGKGLLFLVCILGTFIFGLVLGGGRVVYHAPEPSFVNRWQYYLQACIGLPALPAIVQHSRVMRGELPLVNDKFMRPPYYMNRPPFKPGYGPNGKRENPFRTTDHTPEQNEVVQPNELSLWHYQLGSLFELGTTFTVIAGLLNVLAIFDALAGPMVTLTPAEKQNT